MRSEYEKLIIYTDTLELVLKGAFETGYFSGNHTKAEEYAKEKIEHVRQSLADIVVKHNDLKGE
jgi:hypothetical protein